MELSGGFADMESEIDKMATTFLDLIGLQSSKATATSKGIQVDESSSYEFRFRISSQRAQFGISGFIMQMFS